MPEEQHMSLFSRNMSHDSKGGMEGKEMAQKGCIHGTFEPLQDLTGMLHQDFMISKSAFLL